MKLLLILPILIPFLTAILSLFAWRWQKVQQLLSVVGTAALLFMGIKLVLSVKLHGIMAVQISNWQAPFGITFVADLFSGIMVALAGLMGLSVTVYSIASISKQNQSLGYFPLLQILLMGVVGAFLTGDIFNLYVWFEVMLISSFVLMVLGGGRKQMEGAIKYVTMNLISSAFFLAAIGLLYGEAGTLNMADLAQKLNSTTNPNLVMTVPALFLVAFGIKAAVFPLFFWLPASYHKPPVAVSAIFAGLLTKVGVYALIRVFTLIFIQDITFTHSLILFVAGLTMVTGVLGAVTQNEFRRVLSFHIISQIGYIIIGLGLFTPLALAGSVFYILHHIIVKTNLFLVSGVVYRLRGTFKLKELGGLYQIYPYLGILFLIPALSLSGIPPLSGFFAKFSLIKAGLEAEQYYIVATALGVSLLTVFSMTKIWAEVFWKPEPSKLKANTVEISASGPNSYFLLLLPIITLAILTVFIGLAAESVFSLAEQAAAQLLNPAEYIQAVFGDKL